MEHMNLIGGLVTYNPPSSKNVLCRYVYITIMYIELDLCTNVFFYSNCLATNYGYVCVGKLIPVLQLMKITLQILISVCLFY